METTHFEQTDSTQWTSAVEGDLFLRNVASETGALVGLLGKTYEGLDILTLRLGTGSRNLLITGGVHPSEPGSREAVYQMMRDVAYNTNEEYTDWLDKYTVTFIPTVNRDVVDQLKRENAQDIDINRDAYRLETPEMAALMSLFTDLDPDIYIDFHERYGFSDSVEFINTMSLDPNTDDSIVLMSTDLVSHIGNRLSEDGYASGPYPPSLIGPGMTVGVSGLLGSVTLTPETSHGAISRWFRVNRLKDVFEHIVEWSLLNSEAVKNMKESFLGDMLRPGDAFTLLNGDTEYYQAYTKVPIVVPEAYIINVPAEIELWQDVYNIQMDAEGHIPIGQPSSRILPLLFDPQSDMRIAEATRIESPDKPEDNTIGRWTKVLYDEWREVFVKGYSSF